MEFSFKEFFKNEKLWKNFLPNYVFRESQLQLVNKIYDSFIKHSCLIAEAGTGTGKTFSYLVPAISYLENCKNQEKEFRILISTETKTLQNQIYCKDIPLLKKILKIEFSPQLCFGSNNYVCLLKLEEYLKQTKKKNSNIETFLDWLNNNFHGILPLYNKELQKEFVVSIQRNTEDCSRNHCMFFSECYYYIEKEKWKESKILITNHHLLSKHLLKSNVLPDFQIAIIDEAHFFPDILRENLTESFSFNELFKKIKHIKKDPKIEKEIFNFYHNVEQFLLKNFDLNLENRCKISGSLEIQNFFSFLNTIEKLKEELIAQLQKTKSFLNSSTYISIKETQKDKNEILLENTIEILNKILNILNQFYNGPKHNFFHYIEKNSEDIQFCIAPIDVGDLIRENLIYKMDCTIFLSATLSTNYNFDFFIKKIGLEPQQVDTITIPSPFDLKKQVLLYIPFMSEPNSNSYLEECSKEIVELIKLVNGRTLILFTSKKNLEQIYNILKNKFYDSFFKEYTIISQEEGIQKSIQKFLRNQKSILLGLNSLRQGIDLPNETLKCVILVKLPFSVPTDPLISSLIERETDLDAFTNIVFPDMLIKLKQGMGRLIRSERDKGIICLLDSRIYTKSYGNMLLEYLKNFKIYNQFTDLKRDYEIFKL